MSRKNTIEGGQPSAEEEFYLEAEFKEPVESLDRLEDLARFLITVQTTLAGLLISALRISLPKNTTLNPWWLLPLGLWCAATLCFLLALIPRQYAHGKSQPKSFKEALISAQQYKWQKLKLGVFGFLAGLIAAACIMIFVKSLTE